MSAVTLQEIADLVADKLGVPIAEMRNITASPDMRRVRDARMMIVLLAQRHTQVRIGTIAAFLRVNRGNLTTRFDEFMHRGEPWRCEPLLAAALEDVEQQIDALHERRMADRDRRQVMA